MKKKNKGEDMNLSKSRENGSLLKYLNSSKMSIGERLAKAEQAFYAPLKYPPQCKEGLVLGWIVETIVSNKVSDYSRSESTQIWSLFHKLVSSVRLKKLCSQNWICPVPSAFIQAMIDNLNNEKTSDEIKMEIISIVGEFKQNPVLSVQSAFLNRYTTTIALSLMKFINKRPIDEWDESILEVLAIILNETHQNIRCLPDHTQVLEIIYGDFLFMFFEMGVKLLKCSSDASLYVMIQIQNIYDLALQKEMKVDYASILQKSYYVSGTKKFSSNFFYFLNRCSEHKDRRKGGFFLKEFLMRFAKSYSKEKDLQIKLLFVMIKNVIPLPLISKLKSLSDQTVQNDGIIQLNKKDDGIVELSTKDGSIIESSKKDDGIHELSIKDDSIVELSENDESIVELPKDIKLNNKQVFFLSSILEGLLTEHFENSFSLTEECKKNLEIIMEILLKSDLNENCLQCIRLILKTIPESVVNIQNLLDTIVYGDKTGREFSGIYDKLLCGILSVYVQLRRFDEFFETLLEIFLSKNNSKSGIFVPQLSLSYSGDCILPHNFMRKLLITIGKLNVQLSLNLWSIVIKILQNKCEKLMEDNMNVKTLNLCLWLISECVGVNSFVEQMTTSNSALQVAQSMNSLAEALQILLNKILDSSNSTNILDSSNSSKILNSSENIESLASALKLCFTWAELHARFRYTDTGYMEHTRYKDNQIINSKDAFDFSQQIPFISQNDCLQIESRVKTSKDKALRRISTQLLMQKITLLNVEEVSHNAVTEENEKQSTKYSDMGLSCLESIFKPKHLRDEGLCNLIIFNFPLVAPYMTKEHFCIFSSAFLNGLEAGNEAWKQFASSNWFKETPQLQSALLTIICTQLIEFSTYGKKQPLENVDNNDSKENLDLNVKSLDGVLRQIMLTLSKDVDHLEILEVLKMFITERKSLNSVKCAFRKNKDGVLQLLALLEYFPLNHLGTNLLSNVMVLLFSLIVEVGGFSGDVSFLVPVLKINFKLCGNPNLKLIISSKDAFLLKFLIAERKLVQSDGKLVKSDGKLVKSDGKLSNKRKLIQIEDESLQEINTDEENFFKTIKFNLNHFELNLNDLSFAIMSSYFNAMVLGDLNQQLLQQLLQEFLNTYQSGTPIKDVLEPIFLIISAMDNQKLLHPGTDEGIVKCLKVIYDIFEAHREKEAKMQPQYDNNTSNKTGNSEDICDGQDKGRAKKKKRKSDADKGNKDVGEDKEMKLHETDDIEMKNADGNEKDICDGENKSTPKSRKSDAGKGSKDVREHGDKQKGKPDNIDDECIQIKISAPVMTVALSTFTAFLNVKTITENRRWLNNGSKLSDKTTKPESTKDIKYDQISILGILYVKKLLNTNNVSKYAKLVALKYLEAYAKTRTEKPKGEFFNLSFNGWKLAIENANNDLFLRYVGGILPLVNNPVHVNGVLLKTLSDIRDGYDVSLLRCWTAILKADIPFEKMNRHRVSGVEALILVLCSKLSRFNSDQRIGKEEGYNPQMCQNGSDPKSVHVDHSGNISRIDEASDGLDVSGNIKKASVGLDVSSDDIKPIGLNENLLEPASLHQDTSIQDQLKWILRSWDIFSSILEVKKEYLPISTTSKTLILNSIFSVDFDKFGGKAYADLFKRATAILLKLEDKHHSLVDDRITLVVNAIKKLVASLAKKACQNTEQTGKNTEKTSKNTEKTGKNNDLSPSEIQSYESLSLLLERVVRGLEKYKENIYKLAPLCLGSIVEIMARTSTYLPVRSVLERMVYALLDMSDKFGVRHLMVAMSPSATTLLKHLYTNFRQSYMYRPRRH